MDVNKPLHVRVAEALGWEWHDYPMNGGAFTWKMLQDPLTKTQYGEDVIPRFDLEWSCGGPLIEKYGITLTLVTHGGPPKGELLKEPYWRAEVGHYEWYDGTNSDHSEDGPTPLLAICALVVALKESEMLNLGENVIETA